MSYQVKLTKRTLCLTNKVSQAFMDQMNITIGYVSDDFIKELYTTRLEAFVLEKLIDSKHVIKYAKPQRFWDWVFRRSQKFEFVIQCKEILNNPPDLPEHTYTLLYGVKEL